MKLLNKIRRAFLTDYECTLFDFLEGYDKSEIPHSYHMHLHTDKLSFFGKDIIESARMRFEQRLLHADLLQRIANGGKNAQEMQDEEEKKAMASKWAVPTDVNQTIYTGFAGTFGGAAVKVEGESIDILAAYPDAVRGR